MIIPNRSLLRILIILYNSKIKLLYTAFFHSLKLSENRIGIKIYKDPLSVEQNNYLIKIVNVYMIYNLDAWPINPANNFKFKNYLFRETNIVENSDKEKYVYSGYGTTFDNAGSWSFGNDFARILQFLVLIIVHPLILTIAKIFFKY